jgi:hypothetical protein
LSIGIFTLCFPRAGFQQKGFFRSNEGLTACLLQDGQSLLPCRRAPYRLTGALRIAQDEDIIPQFPISPYF